MWFPFWVYTQKCQKQWLKLMSFHVFVVALLTTANETRDTNVYLWADGKQTVCSLVQPQEVIRFWQLEETWRHSINRTKQAIQRKILDNFIYCSWSQRQKMEWRLTRLGGEEGRVSASWTVLLNEMNSGDEWWWCLHSKSVLKMPLNCALDRG